MYAKVERMPFPQTKKKPRIYTCQALTHAVHICERSAKSTGISLPPIDSVEAKLLHFEVLVKVDMVTLRGQRQFVLTGIFLWIGAQEVGLVDSRLTVEEPNSVALHGIDGKSVKVGSNVERHRGIRLSRWDQRRRLQTQSFQRGMPHHPSGRAKRPVQGRCEHGR